MKKFLLFSCTLIALTTAIAQTNGTNTQVTTPKSSINADTSLESVTRNIDRRLVYFNRYKQEDDTESLAKLISEENKDFYINFMKYVKVAPVFTLKRDITQKIVKTPTGDYVTSVIMVVNGKPNKVSMTFIEEMSDRGNKWLISNTNLHIQVPLAKTGNNLASNALNGQNTQKAPQTTPTRTTSTPTKTVSGETDVKPIATVPVVAKPAPTSSTPTSTIPAPTSKGANNASMIAMSIVIVVILGIITGFILWFKKRRKARNIALATMAAATPAIFPGTSVAAEGEVPSVANAMHSNVTISHVDTTPTPIVQDNETVITQEKTLPEKSLEVSAEEIPEKLTETSETSEETVHTPTVTTTETATAQSVAPVSDDIVVIPSPETLPESKITDIVSPETTSTVMQDKTEAPEEPDVASLADIRSVESTVTDTPSISILDTPTPSEEQKSLDDIISASSSINLFGETGSNQKQPHALFESVLNPTPATPETSGLFDSILKS